ncbi:MAG: hypothetical protein ACO1SX_22310 [Actinomycetota bacterium]
MYRVFENGWRRSCQRVSRRELLQVGAASGLGLSLVDQLAGPAAAG